MAIPTRKVMATVATTPVMATVATAPVMAKMATEPEVVDAQALTTTAVDLLEGKPALKHQCPSQQIPLVAQALTTTVAAKVAS